MDKFVDEKARIEVEMKKQLTAAILFASVVAVPGMTDAAFVPVDLNTWSQKGPASNGTWNVSTDGTSVLQTENGNPTFFVSPNDQFNIEIKGKLSVRTMEDNDIIGFVFGYQSPTGNGTNNDFILFSWKEADQTFNGEFSQEGLSLARVNGTNNVPFGHQTENLSEGYDVWATDVGSNRGWVPLVTYDFTLLYQSNRIKIDIQGGMADFQSGETVFDITPSDVGVSSFPNGKFGFYNFSQAQVRYESFVQQDAPNDVVPEPSSIVLFGVGLIGITLMARRRRHEQVYRHIIA